MVGDIFKEHFNQMADITNGEVAGGQGAAPPAGLKCTFSQGRRNRDQKKKCVEYKKDRKRQGRILQYPASKNL